VHVADAATWLEGITALLLWRWSCWTLPHPKLLSVSECGGEVAAEAWGHPPRLNDRSIRVEMAELSLY